MPNDKENILSKELEKLPLQQLEKEYINEIRAYSILSKEEEQRLFEIYRNGDMSAKENLIRHNLRLAFWIALQQFKRSTNRSFELMDFVQEANIGLLRAIESFDPSLQHKFSTYATPFIQGILKSAHADKDDSIRLPRNLKNDFSKYLSYKKSYMRQYGELPSKEQIQRHLQIVDLKIQVFEQLEHQKFISLQSPTTDDKERELGEIIEDPKNRFNAKDNMIDTKILLYHLLQILTPVEYYVVFHHVFYKQDCTLEQLAKEIYVTHERIRQIESCALQKIKVYLESNTHKNSPLQIKQVLDIDYTPTSMEQIFQLYQLKQVMTDGEYYLFYYLYHAKQKKSFATLCQELDISPDEGQAYILELSKKVKVHMQHPPKYSSAEKERIIKRFNGINAFFKEHLTPTYTLPPFFETEQYFRNKQPKDILLILEQYRDLFNEEQLSFLSHYFSIPKQSENRWDYVIAEREINLVLGGFHNPSKKTLTKELRTYYLDHSDLFNRLQQLSIEYHLFSKNKEVYQQYLKRDAQSDQFVWKETQTKIEKLYFGIHNFFQYPLDLSLLETFVSDPTSPFTEEEKYILSLRYGLLGQKPYTLTEMSNLLEVSYTHIHDRIADLREKALDYYCNLLPKKVKISTEEYTTYFDDPRYEISIELKELLKKHIFEEKSPAQIAKELGKDRIAINNQILSGLNKIALYHYKIVNPFLFSKEDLQFVFDHYTYPEEQKQALRNFYLLGKSDGRSIRSLFLKRYLDLMETKFPITTADVQKELLCHETDSILTSQERFVASFYYQIKTSENPTAAGLPEENPWEQFHLSKKNYHNILTSIKHNIIARKIGLRTPPHGIMSRGETLEILNDPRLPILDNEKEILKGLKGIESPAQTVSQLAEKLGLNEISIQRRYLQAILKIRQYQDGILLPKFSLELDILPNLKYFSRYEQNLLMNIYYENKSVVACSKELGVTRDQVANDILNVKRHLALLIQKSPSARTFNFDAARIALSKTDILLPENKDLLIKIYQMKFGDNGARPLSVPQIIDQLQLSCQDTQVSNAIYEVMLAAMKYQVGIRRENNKFTKKQVNSYYQKHHTNLPKDMKIRFEKYLTDTNRLSLSTKRNFFTDPVLYLLFQEYCQKSFEFKSTTQTEISSILSRTKSSFSKKTKDTVLGYYQMPYGTFYNGKEKLKVWKLLLPIYQLEKEKSAAGRGTKQYTKFHTQK